MIMYFVWMGVIFLILTVSILDGMAPAVSIVVAIIALIGVVISAIYSNRKLGETLNTKRMESKGEHIGLGKDHTSLAKDHANLSERISIGNSQLSDKINGVATITMKLREESLKAQAQRQLLSQRELDIKATIEQLTGLIEIVTSLKVQNSELNAKIKELEQQNLYLSEQLEKRQEQSMDFAQ